MKKPLKGTVIAMTGDFGEPRSHQNLERWIESNGGKVAQAIDDDITHLLCTWDDWKKKVPKVRQSLKREVDVVSYDWLEDSLMSKRRKREKPYLLATIEKTKRKLKKKEKRRVEAATKRFNDSIEDADEELLSRNYHVFQDETCFEYCIVLFRADVKSNRNERYQLKLYQSHAVPHFYATTVRFWRPGASGYHILAPMASYWCDAYSAFCKFFRQKVGVEWIERLKVNKMKNVATEDSFVYLPPPPGEPRGVFPPYMAEASYSQDEELIVKKKEEKKEEQEEQEEQEEGVEVKEEEEEEEEEEQEEEEEEEEEGTVDYEDDDSLAWGWGKGGETPVPNEDEGFSPWRESTDEGYGGDREDNENDGEEEVEEGEDEKEDEDEDEDEKKDEKKDEEEE